MPPESTARRDRSDWRVVLSWHLAESRAEASARRAGLMRWHNEYNVGTLQRPGRPPFRRPRMRSRRPPAAKAPPPRSVPRTSSSKPSRSLLDISGGVGAVVGFVHDWANPENTRRSWDMVARYVVPEINNYARSLRRRRNS